MKAYKKTDCKFTGGYIMEGKNVISVGATIATLFNNVEEAVQQAEYLLAQPAAQPKPSLDNWARKSSVNMPYQPLPDTPMLNAQVEQSLAIHAENKAIEAVADLNEYLSSIQPLIEWVQNDMVVDAEEAVTKLDLPTLGNPLELTVDSLVEAGKLVVKANCHIEG